MLEKFVQGYPTVDRGKTVDVKDKWYYPLSWHNKMQEMNTGKTVEMPKENDM